MENLESSKTTLKSLDWRPKELLFAKTIMAQDAGGWHCTRLFGEDTGKTFIKKHKYFPYQVRWFEEVGG